MGLEVWFVHSRAFWLLFAYHDIYIMNRLMTAIIIAKDRYLSVEVDGRSVETTTKIASSVEQETISHK